MTFWPSKPLPPPATGNLASPGVTGAVGPGTPLSAIMNQPGGLNQNAAGPAAGATQQAANEARRMPNARFRSFAERFVVTRSEGFSTDPAQMQQDIWQSILDARVAYDKIKEVSRGVRDDGNEGGA